MLKAKIFDILLFFLNIIIMVIYLNKIDIEFNDLIKKIKTMKEDEIYNHIKNNFIKLSSTTKASCEKFFNQFLYWGKLSFDEENFEFFKLKAFTLYNYTDNFKWLYDNLEDYQSKKILLAILDNWFNWSFKYLGSVIQNLYDDYFDLDLIKECKNEVLVDLGAYTGDSVLSFINNYGIDSYKKIYCYEINEKNLEKMKSNLNKYENVIFKFKGVSDCSDIMYLKENEALSASSLNDEGDIIINTTSLDEDIKEKITIIKSDIEGGEYKALLGAKNHIINDHPKLLFSIYHSNDDVWRIPKLIKDMDSSYKFYLRYHGGPIYPTEITLIAI